MKIVFALLAVSTAPLRVAATTQKFKFGQDTNWPPYAFKNATGGLEGIGKDIADGMTALCDNIEIEVVYTKWEDCWTSDDKLGAKLADGSLDACMTYTHARGARDAEADWSMAFLKVDKAAGLITKLDADGMPKVKGNDDLAGKVVADVGGWAPTADTIEFVKNQCTNKSFAATKDTMKVITQTTADKVVNDESLKEVLDGKADALYLYADSAENFKCKDDGKEVEHNCSLWTNHFGKPNGYAYFQTGQFGWTINGTTLAMTKPGTDLGKLNHCMYKFMQTTDYYDICKKHGFECDCIPNSHWPESTCTIEPYNKPTSEHTSCSTGYCPCPATADTVVSGAHRHTVSVLPTLALILISMIFLK